MGLYAVVAGQPTLGADINQYFNLLTGASTGGLLVNGGSNVYTPYIAQESTLPGTLQELFAGQIAGDTVKRIALYMRSDGYAGMYGGTGASTTAHLYAQAGGWQIDESLTVLGNITGAQLKWSGNTTGGAQDVLDIVDIKAGGKHWEFDIGSDGSIHLLDVTDSKDATLLDTSGNTSLPGNLAGPVGGGIPTTRNGVATSVPIYTGTNTPSSPPTGSIWVKA